MMLKMVIAALLISSFARAMTAQQNHFACHTRAGTVFIVQEDAAGSISLTRNENEPLPELDMTAMTQKQILVAKPGASQTVISNDGDKKEITLNFHGKTTESQVVLTLTKPVFGSSLKMSITGNGAAMDRVRGLLTDSRELTSDTCNIEIH